MAESICVFEPSSVVIVPVWSSPERPVIDEVALKLKQYKAEEVRSPEVKVTELPETPVALAEIEGQLDEPEGRFDTLVAQLLKLGEMVNCDGKATIIFATPEFGIEGSAHTVPERGEEIP